jgi:hypothetical protein
MQFITNRIRTGKAKSFSDLVKELTQPKQETVKTASTQEPVKVAAEDKKETKKDEGPSSGQLDVEPLHQKGESTEMPKKGPSAKKDDDKAKVAATDTQPDKEGKDSEQPKWEGEQKNNNKPEAKEDTKGGEAKVETKEAGLEMCPDCKKPGFACKCKKDGEKGKEEDCGGEGEKPCKAESKVEAKKAEVKMEFVKIANLDGKNKSWLRKFWRQLYPEQYVDAMLADK